MKTILFAVAATTAISSSAIAGNPAPVAVQAVAPVAAAVTDWSGPYAGASFSLNSGRQDYFDSQGGLTPYDGMEGEHYGVFAGYNMQRGSMVFGGEVAYSMGTINWPEYQDEILENLLDIKARAGFAAGNVLVYGVAAYTMGHYQEGPTYSVDATGFSYGAGVEMKFGEHMFAGIEYLARDIGGVYNEAPDESVDFIFNSIQLRAGWQF